MYQPLPSITEDLDTLEDRLHRERDPKRKPRLHLLVLIKSGQVTSRRQAATHLALHRNTVAAWLHRYRAGGLEALLTYKEAGAPAGQKTLPPAVLAQLQARLATSSGFASYVESNPRPVLPSGGSCRAWTLTVSRAFCASVADNILRVSTSCSWSKRPPMWPSAWQCQIMWCSSGCRLTARS